MMSKKDLGGAPASPWQEEAGWRDVKTAPAMEPILVSYGGRVYVGTLRSNDFRSFVGCGLNDGQWFLPKAERLDGWMPVPDTWKQPEKTADEMFREMTPMEAWANVSRRLTELDRQGYTHDDLEAEAICFQALKKMGDDEDGNLQTDT